MSIPSFSSACRTDGTISSGHTSLDPSLSILRCLRCGVSEDFDSDGCEDEERGAESADESVDGWESEDDVDESVEESVEEDDMDPSGPGIASDGRGKGRGG